MSRTSTLNSVKALAIMVQRCSPEFSNKLSIGSLTRYFHFEHLSERSRCRMHVLGTYVETMAAVQLGACTSQGGACS